MEMQQKKKKRKISAIHILMPITAILLILTLVANYAMSYFDYIINSYIFSHLVYGGTGSGSSDSSAKYSDTAVVWIARHGGEGQDEA